MDILITHWHCILPIVMIVALLVKSLSESRKEKRLERQNSEDMVD